MCLERGAVRLDQATERLLVSGARPLEQLGARISYGRIRSDRSQGRCPGSIDATQVVVTLIPFFDVPHQPEATKAAPASAVTPPMRRAALSRSASTRRARTTVTIG